jgi:hypothetical protein
MQPPDFYDFGKFCLAVFRRPFLVLLILLDDGCKAKDDLISDACSVLQSLAKLAVACSYGQLCPKSSHLLLTIFFRFSWQTKANCRINITGVR